MRAVRFLGVLEPLPGHALVAGDAAIGPAKIGDPDLLHARRHGLRPCRRRIARRPAAGTGTGSSASRARDRSTGRARCRRPAPRRSTAMMGRSIERIRRVGASLHVRSSTGMLRPGFPGPVEVPVRPAQVEADEGEDQDGRRRRARKTRFCVRRVRGQPARRPRPQTLRSSHGHSGQQARSAGPGRMTPPRKAPLIVNEPR